MELADEEMPGTRPGELVESGPILGLSELQPEMTGYTIDGSLGTGAMGAVYAATDPDGRSVAIKVLHDPQPDDMTQRRFEREVAALRKLDHPGVPDVYDSGRLPDGRLFLVMERLHGITLEDWYDKPGHTRLEALELIVDALDAIAVAHVRGVVHRDVKPENIFVLDTPDRGLRVKMLDFGIALHPAEGEMKRTATGVSVGTPCYMSPEQAARPKLVGPYSDVWSIGVVLYEVLCGELPFDGETAHGVVVSICAEAHVPLAERSPQTHPDLLNLVESCLIKARDDRPINAAELKDALAGLLARDEVRETLSGPAATPDLRLSRPSAVAFAETEEFTDPEQDDLAIAQTVSAELHPASEKSRAPILLAIMGVLLGVAVAILYVQNTPPAVASEAPVVTAPAVEPEPEPEPVVEEPVVAPEPEPESEVEVADVPEPDLVVRPRMRPRMVEPVAVVEPEPEPEPEPVVEPEPAMEPVAVMEPTMEPVAAMEPTMQPVQTVVRSAMMRRPPRMRPAKMRRNGDRPGFVTF